MNSCTDLWQILMKIDIQPFYLVPRKLYYYAWFNRCRWLCGLGRRSEAAWLLGSRVRIPLTAWIFVSCVCCVDRGLCDELITRDLETSATRRPGPELRGCTTEKKVCCRFEFTERSVLCYALRWSTSRSIKLTHSQYTDIIVHKIPI
jgi:hypothetical protein